MLPIGGLKEKLLAAHRGGIKTVVIPAENEKDLKEIPENVKSNLDIVSVKWMDEVLALGLESCASLNPQLENPGVAKRVQHPKIHLLRGKSEKIRRWCQDPLSLKTIVLYGCAVADLLV